MPDPGDFPISETATGILVRRPDGTTYEVPRGVFGIRGVGGPGTTPPAPPAGPRVRFALFFMAISAGPWPSMPTCS